MSERKDLNEARGEREKEPWLMTPPNDDGDDDGSGDGDGFVPKHS